MKSLQQIQNMIKREINAKSPQTKKLRTVRISKMTEFADLLEPHKGKSGAAKKAFGYISRDINHCYKEGVPPRRGELKKAYEALAVSSASNQRKSAAGKTAKKAA